MDDSSAPEPATSKAALLDETNLASPPAAATVMVNEEASYGHVLSGRGVEPTRMVRSWCLEESSVILAHEV